MLYNNCYGTITRHIILNNFLFISPKFPPNSAIGSKRALNIARHIFKYGWQPVVLAAPVPEHEQDNSMMKILPDNTAVFYQFASSARKISSAVTPRTSKKNSLVKKIMVRGPYYTPFDQYLSQVPAAIRAGKKLIREYKPELILVNADPWSGLIVGYFLSKWANIPWIADLRDPWSLHAFKMALRPWPVRNLVRYFESIFFHSAALVVLNTRKCCSAYQEKYKTSLDKSRFTYIRNAFDPGCYDTPDNNHTESIFSLHYFGSFRIYQDSGPLFELFKQFVLKHQLNPGETELVLYGDKRDVETELLKSLNIMPYIKYQNNVNMVNTLVSLNQASVLILLEGPNKCLQLPAKLYDYLAARKPVLALTDNTELAEIINTTESGIVASYHDTDDALFKLEQLYIGRTKPWRFNDAEIARYSVDYQISEFVRIFNAIKIQHA